LATVLVADDDRGVRAMIRGLLEGDGHRVLEAGSAVELFALLDVELPDVMLLDVHLGADDGLAIGAGLRRELRYKETKLVFVTGTLDNEELVRQSRLFKVPILPKPFATAELLAAIAA
jgi:DNA-binding response OmpR family regulator